MGVRVQAFSCGVDAGDGAGHGVLDVLDGDGLTDERREALPGTKAHLSGQLSVELEVGAKHLGNSERPECVRDRSEDFGSESSREDEPALRGATAALCCLSVMLCELCGYSVPVVGAGPCCSRMDSLLLTGQWNLS